MVAFFCSMFERRQQHQAGRERKSDKWRTVASSCDYYSPCNLTIQEKVALKSCAPASSPRTVERNSGSEMRLIATTRLDKGNTFHKGVITALKVPFKMASRRRRRPPKHLDGGESRDYESCTSQWRDHLNPDIIAPF